MMSIYDCIVPFYNEGKRVISVVDALSRVQLINKIICVDDGSTDHASEKLKKKFPKIILIRLHKNSGKSAAVFSGLRRVTSDTVLLFDGDLAGVQPEEIESACEHFSVLSLDMLILKVSGEIRWKLMDEFFRNYIVQSGMRILSISDLREIEKLHPTGYQLEVAINQYMIDHGKSVAWTQISAINPHKTTKFSWFGGWKRDISMDREIMSYLGPLNRFLQILFFCRKQV